MSAHLTDVSLPAGQRAADPSLHPDFAATLAHHALTWHQQPDEAATLQAITAAAPRLLRGADAAAVVTVSTSATLHITAAHGPIDKVQAALHRTLDTNMWTGREQPEPATPTTRWPVSATLDHHAEMGSMLGAPLGSGRIMFGTLLVLGFATDAFTRQSSTDLTTVAIHASIALAAARQKSHLHEAVASRDIIGQAKGILMSQRHLTAEQAFDRLLAASQHGNIKLRQIAEDVCRTGELPDPPASQ